MAEEGERTSRRRVRPVLLVLLWVWAVLVFVVIDLFRNVPAFDRIRPDAKLYEGMRRAAHRMVGETYRGPLREPRDPVRAVAATQADGVGYEDPERARKERPGERSVYRALRNLGVARGTAGGYTKWNDPGPRPGRGALSNGQRDGAWTWRWPDGATRETREYRKGILHGTVTASYPDGTKQVEERYENGVPQGAWKWWFPDGKPAIEAAYVNGKLDGSLTKWHENGQVALRGELRKGEREGDWTEYDENGNEIGRAVYTAGRQVG